MAFTKTQLDAYIQALYDDDGQLSSADYQLIINYILSNGEPQTNPRDLIQIRRGDVENIPHLAQGEMAVTLDTEELFVGGLNGNIRIGKSVLIDVKSFGAKGDGTTNDTAKIQTGVDFVSTHGGTLYISDGEYIIDTSDVGAGGIKLKDNVNIEFSQGASFKSNANNANAQTMLDIYNVDNVRIVNPVCVGDKDTHTNPIHDSCFAINIMNSENVTIENPKIYKWWDDGIYIGVKFLTPNLKRTDHILINNPVIDDVGRNGISVCSGGRITINNPVISNVTLVNPKAGIDIEPESQANTPYLENLVINNPLTKNCGLGVAMILAGIAEQSTNIEINNHVDEDSNTGFALFNFSDITIGGRILYNKPACLRNKVGAISISNYGLKMPRFELINPSVINPNETPLGTDETDYGISVRPDQIAFTTGNVYISNPRVIDNRTIKNTRVGLYLSGDGIIVENPIELSGTVNKIINYCLRNSKIVDPLEVFKKEDTYEGGIEINGYNYTHIRKTTNAAGWINYTLGNLKNSEVILERSSAYPVLINTGAYNLLPIATTGQVVTLTSKGTSITIEPLDDTNFIVKNIVGTYTVA